MRRLFLFVLGFGLPCALTAGGLYSIAPVSPGGDLTIPASRQASLMGSGAATGAGAFGAPSGSVEPSYSGYSGVPLNPLRPQFRGLHPGALDSLNMASKPRSLRHRWAVGLDSIPAVSIASSSNAQVALPNALSLRWWATERLGIDLLAAGGNAGSQGGQSGLQPHFSSTAGGAFYPAALGLRYNVSQLSHDLISEIVVKASGLRVAGSAGASPATQTTLAVFVGAGFEAFLPWWNWLSVEGSVGVTGYSQSFTPQGGAAQAVRGLGLTGNGFSPVNLAAHAYF